MLREKLVSAALEAGAYKAVILEADSVVLSPMFRDICRSNQCGKYGKCWMCPPDLPDAEEVMAKVKSYRTVLWYQTVSQIEDSFDIEGMIEAGEKHVHLSQRLQTQMCSLLTDGFLHLTCGGCRLCEECAKVDGEPCRMPDKALPSLEGYCVDVYNTTKDTPLKYINGQNTVTYFGAILF